MPCQGTHNNVAERDVRQAVVGRKNFYGSGSQWSGSQWSGQLAATMYSVLMTARLWKLNARTWLSEYLQACADNGHQALSLHQLNAFLPWAMDAARLAAMRACPTVARRRADDTARDTARVPQPRPRRHPSLGYFMSIYCGREFSSHDIQTIKGLMAQNPALQRAPMSRQLCQLWGWTKPNGELNDMSCRVALLRMQADGLITLPPSRLAGFTRSKPHFPPTAATDPQQPLRQPVHELDPLRLCRVTGSAVSRLWNEAIARYHYLGYTPMSGAQLRYNVYAGQHLVALLSFGASAWKLAGRDRYIGWQQPQRLKNLQLVVNNARFLILPWIQSKGLASKILSRIARQLPNDWNERYGYRPVLLETFVENQRHRGTCYKAANWTHVGQTAGCVFRRT